MVIGVLGKGGVGKSTIASQLALYFATKEKCVLAIDADYNMDMVFNISGGTPPEDMNYFGTSRGDMALFLHLQEKTKFADGLLSFDTQQFVFSKDEVDPFTQTFSHPVSHNLSAMVCGPETNDILYGQACGHSLSAPLKLYLPLLRVGEGARVIVDEKAGSDGVNTGIISGCDMVYIVTDPSLHGTKTAKQIARLANYFQVPYVFIANKVQGSEDVTYIQEQIGEACDISFLLDPAIARNPGGVSQVNSAFFEEIETHTGDSDNQKRLMRSREKFQRLVEYQG